MSDRSRSGAPGRKVGDPLDLSGGLASSVALGVVTLVTGIGMGRLFQGMSYLAPILVVGVASHALSFGLRRAKGFPPILVGPVCIGAVMLVSTWLVFPGATALGIPDQHTLHVLSKALSQARLDFNTLTTPVPATPGFLWLASLAIGATGALADTAAFRLGAPIEGVLPAFAVFLFTAGLGTSTGRTAGVGIWLAAVMAYLLLVEVEHRYAGANWMSNGGPAGWSMFPAGAALAAVAVLGALLVGPVLPGAGAKSVFTSAASRPSAPSQRVTISPLVNIRAELLQPSSVTVFTVSSPVPSYWRLTALDNFNGTVWSADNAYQPAGTALPATLGPESSLSATQVYDISGLAEDWLPAAYLPVALAGASGAGYNQASGSIIAAKPTYKGLTYEVESEIPHFTSSELSNATVSPPSSASAQDYGLPSSLPESVRALALRVTAGALGPYAKALALQNFFRDNFTYSLDATPSNADNALVNFLFVTRKGYCQQFAGAYAVMARVVGLPTRVAVGFTPGQLESDGLFHVEALDAHAWPEVDLGQYGWVTFEPTPGRGEPGAASYTGVTPAQAQAMPSPTTRSSTAPSTASSPVTTPATAAQRRSPATTAAARTVARRVPAHGIGTLAILGLVVVGLIVLLAIEVAALGALGLCRRKRRWAGATGPATALAAFADASEVLAWSGRPRHPAETYVAYARRLAPDLPPGAAPALLAVALQAERAAYAPGGAGSAVGAGSASIADLHEMVRSLSTAMRQALTPGRRLLWWVDPRARLGLRRPTGWTRTDRSLLVRDPLGGRQKGGSARSVRYRAWREAGARTGARRGAPSRPAVRPNNPRGRVDQRR